MNIKEGRRVRRNCIRVYRCKSHIFHSRPIFALLHFPSLLNFIVDSGDRNNSIGGWQILRPGGMFLRYVVGGEINITDTFYLFLIKVIAPFSRVISYKNRKRKLSKYFVKFVPTKSIDNQIYY